MGIQKIMTGNCRLSFPHLFQPAGFGASTDENAKKYSACLLIRKDDQLTLQRLQAAMDATIRDGIQSKWGGKRPSNLKLPIRDGDTERDGGEYKGHYFVNVTTKRKPQVVRLDGSQITDPAEAYAGCYVRATLTCYAYDFAGNRGVSFGLGAVQKLGDGEPLGGDGGGASDFQTDAAKAELDDLMDF